MTTILELALAIMAIVTLIGAAYQFGQESGYRRALDELEPLGHVQRQRSDS